jgi:putative endonuclease
MFYVYVICSISHPKRYYIGFTENIDQRVKEHNEGKSLHTAKYGPWELAVYLAVPSKTKALDLERYLKSGSGRAFLQRQPSPGRRRSYGGQASLERKTYLIFAAGEGSPP